MDEQATPGVFGSSGGGSGGGTARAPQAAAEAARAQYHIPGILHFLRHEWARFEVERAQWEVERAELQAQVSFLQGERRGQENLKKDLVRRIKMLEFSLRQERRAKHHRLRFGTELTQGEVQPPSYDSDEGDNSPSSPPYSSHQLSWKQGRQLLRLRYLQEVGYTDAVLDVKSQRVRTLLGLAADAASVGGAPASSPRARGALRPLLTLAVVPPSSTPDSAAASEALGLLERAAAGFIQDDEDASGGGDKSVPVAAQKPSSTPSSTTSDLSEDPDTEEALKGFDFLASPDELDGWRSGEDGGDWEGGEPPPLGELSWDVDQGLLAQLKEQYRKERKGKKGVKRPNRSNLQDMLANLRDTEDIPPLQPPLNPPSRCPASKVNDSDLGRPDDEEAMSFLPSAGKSFILGRVDEAVSNELGLGDLAGLTVANEADAQAYEVNNQDALRKTWSARFTLRSHFDSVRNLAFHPVEPLLVTASEDQTVKLWNLQKTTPAKKCAALDVEPIYTFRAHSGAVLCVTMSSSGEQCFSGGVDGTIQSWNTPDAATDPYDPYEPSILRGALCGHTDSVWALAYSSAHHRLLSCSADGTVRVWDAATTAPALRFSTRAELGPPTSVDAVSSEPAHMVAAFAAAVALFNMETQQRVLTMEAGGPPASSADAQVNRVLSHPTLPVTITAQDDRHIRFYDNNTGQLIHAMVAHLDAVTCLAVDPNGLYLMSGSHDCSVRLWNMESRTCIQEFTAHRRKLDESVHDVAFHPSRCYIGSAGADALAKVFV
uniref:Striatin, calmodulin binding protein n=1 Tax=Tetraodon nigroviridis TaxID=99883 RepID=H3CGL5_TETNG